ncbi:MULTISPECIES: hypothetical protein [unclassified Allobranchiibius]|uniref:hypothetical protein n=1 Tax=unclassified Allobranchiibius TaxID=2649857 RepID=UPI001AA142AA|nr:MULTISPECIES: hypothetical protein [unclassified Allobranchiibius]MBO1767874.1 hypothetical protein [Allobranchiibius sp. GilTou38]UIJ36179.1 hypothetical protein LVQ62_07370 [Allobranchiibius sp. GilTou73]
MTDPSDDGTTPEQDAPAGTTEADDKRAQTASAGATAADAESASDDPEATDG